MGQFVKIGTTAEIEDLEAGKQVEAGGKRIAIFDLDGNTTRSRIRAPIGADLCHRECWRIKTGAVLTLPAQRNVKTFPMRIVENYVEVEIE
jgi:hypothetical protein